MRSPRLILPLLLAPVAIAGASAKDVNHVYGMAVAYETVKVLKAAGKNPTRISAMAQTRKLKGSWKSFGGLWSYRAG